MTLIAGNMPDSAVDSATMMPDTPSPPPGILVSDRFTEAFGYHVRRSAGTRDWLITYTVAGEGRFRLGSLVQTCLAGDIVALAPGSPHDYATATPERGWDFYWAHFIPRPHWAYWLQLPESGPGLYALSISDMIIRYRIAQAFERLLQDNRGVGAFREELALNALEEVLILIAQQHSQNMTRPLDPRLEAVLHWLSQHLSEPLTVPDLARLVSLSPSRLAHLFKEQMGDSIIETLLKLRLRQASRLLEFTARHVGEIAQDVGFQSPFHFSRQFKAHYGMSPLAYRRQVQSKDNFVSQVQRGDELLND